MCEELLFTPLLLPGYFEPPVRTSTSKFAAEALQKSWQVPRLAVVVELEVAVEEEAEAVALEAVGVRPGLQAVGNTGVPSGDGWLTGRSWT